MNFWKKAFGSSEEGKCYFCTNIISISEFSINGPYLVCHGCETIDEVSNNYFNCLNDLLKRYKKPVIQPYQVSISRDLFNIKNLGVSDFTLDSELNLFLNFIDLKKKSINRVFHKLPLSDKPHFLDKFISGIIENVYNANKLFKLRLHIDSLDKIYIKIHNNLDYNNPDRINFILRKLFKCEYQHGLSFYNIINSYNITADISYLLYSCEHDGQEYFMFKEYYEYEQFIVDYFQNTLMSPTNIVVATSENCPLELDEYQRFTVQECLKNNLSIITGGPGTGKTTIIKTLMNLCKTALVLAPTGCAVENVKEKSSILERRCFTLHSFYYKMLKKKDDALENLDPSAKSSVIRSDAIEAFKISKQPVIIIDEFSMVDIFIFRKVLQVIPWKCKIILVGDPEQLPSIKLGQLLKDFINSNKIPTYKLEYCYRSQDGIITVLKYLLENDKIGCVDDSVILFSWDEIESIVGSNLYEYFVDLGKTIICPTNNAANELNSNIQKQNENAVLYTNKYLTLKQNDKVMFLKNMPEDKLYNGTVLLLQNVKTKIDLNGGYSEITLDFGKKKFTCLYDELNIYIKLCYATTVHKAQGKEYDVVFLVFNSYPRVMHDKKLIYTAMSRAKSKCYIYGKPSELQSSCRINKNKFTSIPALLN